MLRGVCRWDDDDDDTRTTIPGLAVTPSPPARANAPTRYYASIHSVPSPVFSRLLICVRERTTTPPRPLTPRARSFIRSVSSHLIISLPTATRLAAKRNVYVIPMPARLRCIYPSVHPSLSSRALRMSPLLRPLSPSHSHSLRYYSHLLCLTYQVVVVVVVSAEVCRIAIAISSLCITYFC